MVLVVAAVCEYAILEMDAKSASVYGDIDAHIYVKQLEGHHDGT